MGMTTRPNLEDLTREDARDAWFDYRRRAYPNENYLKREVDVFKAGFLAATERASVAYAALRAVLAVHARRPHRPGDFVAFAQTEFPDLCAKDLRPWPCPTVEAVLEHVDIEETE